MKNTDEIPVSLSDGFGSTKIDRGLYENQLCMYAWTAVPLCQGSGCPAFLECDSEKKHTAEDVRLAIFEGATDLEVPRCEVLMSYMYSISNIIFRNYGDSLTEPQLYRIGMHLLPLYKILGKLKLAELVDGPVITTNDKGTRQISPIYKEIREQIKLIEHTWDTIGLKIIDEAGSNIGELLPEGKYDELHNAVQANEKKVRIKRRTKK